MSSEYCEPWEAWQDWALEVTGTKIIRCPNPEWEPGHPKHFDLTGQLPAALADRIVAAVNLCAQHKDLTGVEVVSKRAPIFTEEELVTMECDADAPYIFSLIDAVRRLQSPDSST